MSNTTTTNTNTTGAKVKMDKVRRLLGNRYGEDGRVATIGLLEMVLGEYVADLRKCTEENVASDVEVKLTVEQIDLAEKCIKDLVARAKKEPKVVDTEDDAE